MHFRILGPLEYSSGGVRRPPAGGRQQRLLASFLVHRNRTLSEDHLMEALWGDRLPATAARQVVNGISSLRRELLRHGGPQITHGPGGYLLRLEGHTLDAQQFLDHSAAARAALKLHNIARAREELQAGLGLWRGSALSGMSSDALRVAATGLNDRRAREWEQLAGLELRPGCLDDALDIINEALTLHPMRDGLVAAQMVALVGVGSRPDALRAFMRFRTEMVAELGLEPQRRLVELHRRVLEGASMIELLPVLRSDVAGVF